MHIDRYDFGQIVIDGVVYRQDLLVWPGQIKKDWWRKEGHLLQVDDVAEGAPVPMFRVARNPDEDSTLPYVLWVSFATVLNAAIVRLN